MTSSHVYESEIDRISDDIIDNGYYVARGRPREGMRQVWFPKDDGDLEFFDSNNKIIDNEEGANQDLIPADFHAQGTAS